MFEKLVIKICIVCVVVVLALIIYDILSFSFIFEKRFTDSSIERLKKLKGVGEKQLLITNYAI